MRRAATLLALAFSAFADEASRRTPVVRAVERDGPAVVNVSTERVVVQAVRDPFFDPFFEDFFGRVAPPTRKVKTTSLGSGVLVDPDGYLVTNEHVIRKASRIHVTLSDGTALDADLIASDREADLALCRVRSEKPLPFVRLDAVSDPMMGETAIAIGNPFGLENSVSVGVVSAKNRSLMSEGHVAYRDLVQTDASINPGNSGGALLNADGELIGINTAIYSDAEGIGFAVPVSRVRTVLSAMLDPRRAGKGWTGLSLGLAAAGPFRGRLAVEEVQPSSPAERAGLKAGDLVTAVGERRAPGFFAGLKALSLLAPDQDLPLEVERGGKALKAALKAVEPPRLPVERLARERLGLALQALTPEVALKLGLGIARGAIVTEVLPGGPAERAGIAPGDVVVRADRKGVADPEALGALLEAAESGAPMTLQVVRGNRIYDVTLGT